jgi:hypothetical protein
MVTADCFELALAFAPDSVDALPAGKLAAMQVTKRARNPPATCGAIAPHNAEPILADGLISAVVTPKRRSRSYGVRL